VGNRGWRMDLIWWGLRRRLKDGSDLPESLAFFFQFE
jgi:hypothetical protein